MHEPNNVETCPQTGVTAGQFVESGAKDCERVTTPARRPIKLAPSGGPGYEVKVQPLCKSLEKGIAERDSFFMQLLCRLSRMPLGEQCAEVTPQKAQLHCGIFSATCKHNGEKCDTRVFRIMLDYFYSLISALSGKCPVTNVTVAWVRCYTVQRILSNMICGEKASAKLVTGAPGSERAGRSYKNNTHVLIKLVKKCVASCGGVLHCATEVTRYCGVESSSTFRNNRSNL